MSGRSPLCDEHTMTKKFKVIYSGGTDGFQATQDVLSGIAEVVHVNSEPEDLSSALIQADALLDASMKVRITNAMVLASKNLKVISCATTGADHIERRGYR